ncbi:MAG: beta-lactamase domain protein [Frankiales bacterium]|nr:beta-lactamase domain protein [Frankiales bacterium]
MRQVTPHAAVILAPNPGPMTLDGTNTWILRAPGHVDSVVIDPGPLHQAHLDAVAATNPVLIVLTHRHFDHSEGAQRLHDMTGADVVSLDPAFTIGGESLHEDGESFGGAGVSLTVIHTPGHSSDSLSLHLVDDNAVLTGDTILGRGTTVVAHPDGVLADYLDSLRRLEEYGDATVLPGHGPELPSAGRVARDYLEHREQRLGQVRAAVAAGAASAREVVEQVYADVDQVLWPAAELSVRAQLDYLAHR